MFIYKVDFCVTKLRRQDDRVNENKKNFWGKRNANDGSLRTDLIVQRYRVLTSITMRIVNFYQNKRLLKSTREFRKLVRRASSIHWTDTRVMPVGWSYQTTQRVYERWRAERASGRSTYSGRLVSPFIVQQVFGPGERVTSHEDPANEQRIRTFYYYYYYYFFFFITVSKVRLSC